MVWLVVLSEELGKSGKGSLGYLRVKDRRRAFSGRFHGRTTAYRWIPAPKSASPKLVHKSVDNPVDNRASLGIDLGFGGKHVENRGFIRFCGGTSRIGRERAENPRRAHPPARYRCVPPLASYRWQRLHQYADRWATMPETMGWPHSKQGWSLRACT